MCVRVYVYKHIYICIWALIYQYAYQPIGIIVREFAYRQGDRSSVTGRVITKTQKMVLDASLLNTQHYKVQIKDKWSNPEKGVAPTLHLDIVAIKKRAEVYICISMYYMRT